MYLMAVQMVETVVKVATSYSKWSTDSTGHGYFHSSPEASSDLIMTLRYGLRAGEEDGRPLEHLGAMFWRIEPGYPNQSP